MKLCKKWQNLGWKDTSDNFYGESYSRTHNGKTQKVCRSPGLTIWGTEGYTMWRAVQFDEHNVPLSGKLYPTMSKALSSLKDMLDL
jgi:hypothetical protein